VLADLEAEWVNVDDGRLPVWVLKVSVPRERLWVELELRVRVSGGRAEPVCVQAGEWEPLHVQVRVGFGVSVFVAVRGLGVADTLAEETVKEW